MFINQLKAAINANPSNAQFASVVYASDVPVAARHRPTQINKQVSARVIVFATGYAYSEAVRRSAARLGQEVSAFETSSTHFEHTDCYSIVENKRSGKPLLFCSVQSATSEYFINGVSASKTEVAEYLTPSAARKLLDNSGTVHNRKNDVTHSLQIRTISIDNIQSIRVNHCELVNS